MKLMFTRPAQWAKQIDLDDDIELVQADVFGREPKLRGGIAMGDSVGGVVTRKALKRLINLFEHHKPDAFLFWVMYCEEDRDKHQLESVRVALHRCKQASPRTVFFYGNGNQASTIKENKPDFNVDAFSKSIDVVLDNTRDPRIHAIYKARGFRTDTLYTFGFDPDEIVGHQGVVAEHDVFFGGSYTGRSRFPNSAFRHELVTRMATNFDVLVCGRGKWPKPIVKKGYVHAMNYPREITKCRVALGCYHADLQRYYTKRTVYSLASGRPYVVRYIPGMEHDFANWQNLVWYKTVDEAVATVKRLLRDQDLADEIGTHGRLTAVANHSWDARLRDMKDVLERHL